MLLSVLSHPIHIRHGIPGTAQGMLDYCEAAEEVQSFQYDPCASVDISSLYTRKFVCRHTGTLMESCKFCDLWSVCCEQSFMELHLLN